MPSPSVHSWILVLWDVQQLGEPHQQKKHLWNEGGKQRMMDVNFFFYVNFKLNFFWNKRLDMVQQKAQNPNSSHKITAWLQGVFN